MIDPSPALLRVENLSVAFKQGDKEAVAVKDVSFDIYKGETVALVGESGSGKSVSALSILQLLPYPLATHPTGNIHFAGEDIFRATPDRLREIRGNRVGMIFQEPMTSLNPLHTIEKQIGEVLILHKKTRRISVREHVCELLKKVGLDRVEERLGAYPHQLSGGQRQRVMIAMALANEPEILIADEPTTALDVTVQAQILQLLSEFKSSQQMSMLYISHDLGVVADIADNIAVMYLGRVIEITSKEKLFSEPKHPYTCLLIESIPKIGLSKDQRLSTIEGNVPIPLNLKHECGFFSRCPKRVEGLCNKAIPELNKISDDHKVSCFLYDQKHD